jgi:hypothetical protein
MYHISSQVKMVYPGTGGTLREERGSKKEWMWGKTEETGNFLPTDTYELEMMLEICYGLFKDAVSST